MKDGIFCPRNVVVTTSKDGSTCLENCVVSDRLSGHDFSDEVTSERSFFAL